MRYFNLVFNEYKEVFVILDLSTVKTKRTSYIKPVRDVHVAKQSFGDLLHCKTAVFSYRITVYTNEHESNTKLSQIEYVSQKQNPETFVETSCSRKFES